MKLLLDTHLLLWLAAMPEKLPAAARKLAESRRNTLYFSAASIWEVAIKDALGRADFRADASVLRRGLLENGYEELAIDGAHAVMAGRLQPLHRDPFDRILVAQAAVEGLTLVTSDAQVAQYPGAIRRV